MPRRLLLSVAFALAAAAAHADDSAPRAHVFAAKLNPASWVAMFVTKSDDGKIGVQQRIPIVHCYDATGKRIAERTGYVPNVARWVNLVTTQAAVENEQSLSVLLSSLTTADGRPFEAMHLPQNEPVVVEFGAEWCAPCRSMTAELEAIPGITLLTIDVDQRHMPWGDIMAVVRGTSGQ